MAYRPRPVQVGDGTTGHGSDDTWSAPQLAEAVLHAPAGQDDMLKTELEKRPNKVTSVSLAADLTALLQHVQDRMYWGFKEAWFSKYGYGTWPKPEEIRAAMESAKKKKGPEAQKEVDDALKKCGDMMAFWNDPEEQWARAFAELVIFSPYGGVGQTYYSTEAKDTDVFKHFPFVSPVPMACQHLSTLCLLSRGFTMGQIGGIGCSCGSAVAQFSAFSKGYAVNFQPETTPGRPEKQKRGTLGVQRRFADGKVDNAGSPPVAQLNNVTGLLEVKITPGSVVAFNGGGPNYDKQNWPTGTTHIASILRVTRGRVQFIDTGVAVGNEAGSRASAEGGTSDHSFRTGAIAAANDVVGVGVCKPPSTADALARLAEQLAETKPLGLVRLAILDTGGSVPVVRFVSKLLHMRRPISYLAWSLRALPVSGLSLIWYIYVPRGSAAESLSQALARKGWPDQAPAALYPNGTSLELWCVVRGYEDGHATVFRRKTFSHTVKLPDGSIKKDEKGDAVWTTDGVWYQDLGQTTYEDKGPGFREPSALGTKLDAPASGTLETWCKSAFGKCYLGRPKPEGGLTGNVEDFTSGVGFFDR